MPIEDMEELSDSVLFSRMARVHDYIQDHLAGDLSVSKLAEVAIISPRWFQRIFHKMSEEAPAQFVRRVRIEHAANLLSLQKNSSIGNIARDCGFGSAELLTRHFKSRFGMTPSEWRKGVIPGANVMNRQIEHRNRRRSTANQRAEVLQDADILNREPKGRISELHLERRPERRLIYTRHFRGYDAGIGAAFERLRDWAQPRGLIGSRTVSIGVGLDNPRVTSAKNCRFLAGFTVEGETELGSGIGTRLIPAGLYAVVGFSGFWSELHLVFSKLFYIWLPKSGVEAVSPCTYLENLATPLDLRSLDCRIALQVRSV